MTLTFAKYYVVTLTTKENGHVRKYVHQLVLEAFVGPRPDGYHACHCDGDRKNNALSNLRWDSPRENVMDKLKHGTMPLGEKHHKNRYSEEQVRQVVALLKDNVSMAEIERLTGVKQNTVSQIKHGRQWHHLQAA
jgi:hypothetical protein